MPSPRDKRKHKKAVARKKKQRKGVSPRSAAIAKTALWAETVAQWPLRLCLCSAWLEQRKQGVILIARDAPDGNVAGALFLFDLGCLGLRGSATIGPEPPAAFDRRLASMGLAAGASRVEPQRALAIVQLALAGAEELGNRAMPEDKALLPILGDPPPDEVPNLPSFGWFGRPLYIEWDDDDVERVLENLRQRCGEGAFHHVEPDGTVRFALSPQAKPPEDKPTELARCDELMQALELFARFGPYDDERAQYSARVQQYVGEDYPEFELNEFELQRFIRDHHFDDGNTVLDLFAASEPLTSWDRSVASAWRKHHAGVFRVVEHMDDHSVIESLAAGIRYVVHPLARAGALGSTPVGSMLPAQIAALDDAWVAFSISPAIEDASSAEEIAAAMAYLNPSLLFDDPALLEAGWKLQREEGEDFERHFGSRVVRVPGNELEDVLSKWMTFRREQLEARVREGGQPEAGLVFSGEPALPADFADSDQVALLFGDEWGVDIVDRFDRFEAVFKDPTLVDSEEHRAVLDEYVRDPGVSPLPFEVVGDANPRGASAVFAAYCHRPDFDWSRDGRALLEEIKKSHYDGLIPETRPMSASFVDALKRTRDRAAEGASE